MIVIHENNFKIFFNTIHVCGIPDRKLNFIAICRTDSILVKHYNFRKTILIFKEFDGEEVAHCSFRISG